MRNAVRRREVRLPLLERIVIRRGIGIGASGAVYLQITNLEGTQYVWDIPRDLVA